MEDKARSVQAMFGRIAGRYDLLNHLLSFNLDKRWRARLVKRIAGVLKPGSLAVDLCCGTGDVLRAIESQGGTWIAGSDFCHPMLVRARHKCRSPLFEADSLKLPLKDDSLNLITCAFGFRNLANYEQGFQEFRRVLKPGGVAAILEFSQPANGIFKVLYDFFSTHALPKVGGMISGSSEAYSYLPDSIRRFPGAEDLASMMKAAGFQRVEFERMTGGVVALHLGYK